MPRLTSKCINPKLRPEDFTTSPIFWDWLTCSPFSIVKLVNPCHLLISAAKKDKWSRDSREIYKYAKNNFKNSELKLKIWQGGHKFSKKMRNNAYKFLIEKLKN